MKDKMRSFNIQLREVLGESKEQGREAILKGIIKTVLELNKKRIISLKRHTDPKQDKCNKFASRNIFK